MNTLTTLIIRHRPTGDAFPYTSFTSSFKESVDLARLTFSPSLWDIDGEDRVNPPLKISPPPVDAPTQPTGPHHQPDLF